MLGNVIISAFFILPLLMDLNHHSLYSYPAVGPAPYQVNRIFFSADFNGEQDLTHMIPMSICTFSVSCVVPSVYKMSDMSQITDLGQVFLGDQLQGSG